MAIACRSMKERFDEKYIVISDTGCWMWISATNANGYGRLNEGGQRGRCRLAHRVSFELHVGPIPDGTLVCHRCDFKACVNPEHLFLGSHTDNARDRDAKGRSNTPRGERAGHAKLTRAQVDAMRTLLRSGERQAAVARAFGVSASTVCWIASGRSWRSEVANG